MQSRRVSSFIVLLAVGQISQECTANRPTGISGTCRDDFKQCPDGSYVDRNPKESCEFFSCNSAHAQVCQFKTKYLEIPNLSSASSVYRCECCLDKTDAWQFCKYDSINCPKSAWPALNTTGGRNACDDVYFTHSNDTNSFEREHIELAKTICNCTTGMYTHNNEIPGWTGLLEKMDGCISRWPLKMYSDEYYSKFHVIGDSTESTPVFIYIIVGFTVVLLIWACLMFVSYISEHKSHPVSTPLEIVMRPCV